MKKTIILLIMLTWQIGLCFGQSDEANRQGPSNISFSVMDVVESDHDFADQKLFSINERVYRDENRQSGYYYYYPTSYSLNWVPNRGGNPYDLKTNYGLDGQVTVTAVLKPKISTRDLALFRRSLVPQATRGKPDACPSVIGLEPMPLADRPVIEFNNLSQFGIAQEQVDVRAPNDLKGDITLSFTTSHIEGLMTILFNDVGLYGNVIITPSGQGVQRTIPIPFNLKIDDPATYSNSALQKSFWREGWRNETEYPVELNYLHILKDEGNGHRIYSWNLMDQSIPKSALASFSNANIIPTQWDYDQHVKDIWVEYTMQQCISCNNTVREKLLGGSGGAINTNITVVIQDVLTFSGAKTAFLRLRSLQADPNGFRKIELEQVKILNDGQSITTGPFYIKPEDKLNFEYKIILVMENGEVHTPRTWTSYGESVLSVGSTQIKAQFPQFRLKDGGKGDVQNPIEGQRKRPDASKPRLKRSDVKEGGG